jgi:hypothetical protein
MIYGYYYIRDGVEVPYGDGSGFTDNDELMYRDSGVPKEFLDMLANEKIGDVEEDIFNPNQSIKDWE